MNICKKCGRVLQDSDLVLHKDYEDGVCYDSTVCCPCGSEDLVEAERCEECGEYFPADELYDGICKGCLKQEMTVDNALKCGEEGGARQTISVNGFLASCFSEDEINRILEEKLQNLIDSSYASAMGIIDKAECWCEEDETYFADWLKSNKK